MITRRNVLALAAASLMVSACSGKTPDPAVAPLSLYRGETPETRALIKKYATIHEIPESLLHRVIQRESTYNSAARNGPYFGLMQISTQTARGMGYSGPPAGLLDAETNLRFAGKYLKGAWLVSRGDQSAAVMWYARGYYYEAKRLGLLEETGLRS
jgi:soluble lytic murein transglycosylase-like protein